MLSAFNIAEKFLKNKQKPFATDVFLNWNQIVGESYSKIVTPYKVSTALSKKVLILKAKMGYGLLIQHESWNILHLVNKYLGQEYFSQVKVIQDID